MFNDVFVLLMIFWIYQSVGCRPVASLDHFLPENLGSADLVEEVQTGSSKIVKVNDYLFLYISLGYRYMINLHLKLCDKKCFVFQIIFTLLYLMHHVKINSKM